MTITDKNTIMIPAAIPYLMAIRLHSRDVRINSGHSIAAMISAVRKTSLLKAVSGLRRITSAHFIRRRKNVYITAYIHIKRLCFKYQVVRLRTRVNMIMFTSPKQEEMFSPNNRQKRKIYPRLSMSRGITFSSPWLTLPKMLCHNSAETGVSVGVAKKYRKKTALKYKV